MTRLTFMILLSTIPFSTSISQAQVAANVPKVGVDTAGKYLRRLDKLPWQSPAYARALQDLGIEFVDDHYFTVVTSGTYQQNRDRTINRLKNWLDYMQEHNIEVIWNLEHSNFRRSCQYVPGQNLFETDPNLHYYKVPAELLEILKDRDILWGFNHDEFEHMQLCSNQFIDKNPFGDISAIADTTGMSLEQAYEALVRKTSEMRNTYALYNKNCLVETVWPVMHHVFARSGWILCPKLLKESYQPVVTAMALGAALEYRDNGTDLWFTPDLWFWDKYPGHSVEELRSALLLAHWLGASRIYVENLDHNFRGKRHPDAQDQLGSLVGFSDPNTYQLTDYGRAFRWYAREYKNRHPRPYTWQDVRCDIAIIRFPDSCWGARNSVFRDRLLGAKDQPSTDITEAWFDIWNILSRGQITTKGLSYNAADLVNTEYKFFCSTPATLVFDHRVADQLGTDFDLAGAKVAFVTGITITEATGQLLTNCVQAGLTCITPQRLAPAQIQQKAQITPAEIPDGSGKWIITETFNTPLVHLAVKDYLPAENEMLYKFKSHTLTITPKNNNPNCIKVYLDNESVTP